MMCNFHGYIMLLLLIYGIKFLGVDENVSKKENIDESLSKSARIAPLKRTVQKCGTMTPSSQMILECIRVALKG